ncbi:MAG TPA: regulatory protein RecX [Acidobacteriota bacterium]|jgi:regulatory protein
MSNEVLEHAVSELALKLLAHREHSARELRTKLRQRIEKRRDRFPQGNVPQAIAAVLADFTDKHYIDDGRFALALARQRRTRRHYGDARIRRDLKQRGIDGSMADRALLELPDSGEAIQAALRSYVARRGEPRRIEDLQRIYRFLVRLGHAPADVRQRLAPYFKKLEARSRTRTALRGKRKA